MSRTPVAILGATGAVGQRFIELLDGHPWFEVAELVGLSSAGKRYGDAVRWVLDGEAPAAVADLTVKGPDAPLESGIAFSAVPGGIAGKVESALAAEGKAVFTNAKDHRMASDVPLMVPDVNPDHIGLVEGRDGFIVANPNFSAVALTTPLRPLHDAFGLTEVRVVTLQALSGAGYPGVPSLDALGNVIPYIGGEEDKIETEPLKILGTRDGETIAPLAARISATATRVPVIEGHTCVVSVTLNEAATPEAAAQALAGYRAPDEVRALPSAVDEVVRVRTEPDRPQPKRDALAGAGMQVTVGRLREDPLSTLKFVALASNTVRGAAGCSVLNAELARARGLLDA